MKHFLASQSSEDRQKYPDWAKIERVESKMAQEQE